MKKAREEQELIKRYEAEGWSVRRTKRGHLVWHSPTGVTVVSSLASKDSRARKNSAAAMKRGACPPKSRYT